MLEEFKKIGLSESTILCDEIRELIYSEEFTFSYLNLAKAFSFLSKSIKLADILSLSNLGIRDEKMASFTSTCDNIRSLYTNYRMTNTKEVFISSINLLEDFINVLSDLPDLVLPHLIAERDFTLLELEFSTYYPEAHRDAKEMAEDEIARVIACAKESARHHFNVFNSESSPARHINGRKVPSAIELDDPGVEPEDDNNPFEDEPVIN